MADRSVHASTHPPAYRTSVASAQGSLTRLAILVGVVASAISAIGSWTPSLWGDEAASVLSAVRPIGSLWPMLAHVDAVHGAYYVGLHLWVDLVGSSAFAVRVPSAFAIGACAASVTWMCGRLASPGVAATAGLLTAVLPRLTYAGEEARSYAFAAAFAAILCAILAEMARRPRATRRWWVAYACVLSLGTWLFLYFGLMILVAGAVVASVPQLRARWRSWLLSSAAAIVAAAPVIVLALGQRGQVSFLAHRDVVNLQAVLVKMWFWRMPFAIVAWTLILIAAIAWVRRLASRRQAWSGSVLEVITFSWLVLPVGVLLATSPFVAGYTARYGTYAAPAAAVAMALGARELARVRWALVASLIAVALAVVPIWLSQRTPHAKNGSDWNDIAALIHEHAEPGDAIAFDEGVRPSRRPRLAMNTNPSSFAAVSDPTLKTAYPDGVSWHDSAFTVTEAAAQGRFRGVQRVWVVEYATGSSVSTWGVADLTRLGYHRSERFTEHRSVICLYER